MRAILWSIFLASGLHAAEAPTHPIKPQAFVIGLSSFLEKNMKDDVYRGVIRLMVQDLPLNSTVSIYDAYNLRTISSVKIPESRVFESPKTRANQFASAILELKQFLATAHPKPTVGRLNFDGALRLPQFCDFLSESAGDSNATLTVLLIGSPLYQDAKEPDFSMVDGYFPSDGHLRTSREKSVFGLSDHNVPSLQVHWVYFGDPWVNDLYRDKVTRFWALYLENHGGRLTTFCGDFPTTLQAFRKGDTGATTLAKGWKLDPTQTKVEMLRIGREVELADWIQRDSLPETAPRAPSIRFGSMKIGIRWKDNIDLDLYATPRPGAQTLFFQHPHSADGFYYKDHRASPGREFEFIEFEKPVDSHEVEAFVNFYKGDCPRGPRGEVRIEFDGKIYSSPFSIAALEGNRGRSGVGQEQFWEKIPVQQILKLSSSERAE